MLSGQLHSEATKEKMRMAHRGRRAVSVETRAKMSAAQMGNTHGLGHLHTPEDRAKQSAAQIGHVVSIETRAKIGAAHKGRVVSPEARANMSAAHIGNTHSPESRVKIGAASKGRVFSLETRAKRSAALKGRVISPEWRAKISASLTGYRHTPEARVNMSSSLVGRSVSLETRKKIGAMKRTHIIERIGCRCGACAPPQSPTRIEDILVDGLLKEFPEVRREERFGLYRVDAYLPLPYHLAFEADGEYWHRNSSKRDAKRDAYLLREHGLPVVRLDEHDFMAMEI